jgi:hypothetical protein
VGTEQWRCHRGRQVREGDQWVQKSGGAIAGDRLEKVSSGYRRVEVP